ncbi:hypothetical protein [Planctomicrobium piriforme]|uniref:Uncharacterized protein n=1 Tax=Planctomicrobium piriforme TaxID=1576369 RepID=A0A1I3CJE8_9PLAN|nr:hypothetical protein [Planctomicrobium piriforme]SFH74724.1 hypothetical protein SAMN05421753_102310 [Planctomicrobium piriforme]
MLFQSNFQTVALAPDLPQHVIAEERNLFRATRDEALQWGGAATQAFVEHLPEDWREDPDLMIRSKLAWLREGWYPLHQLLGWHSDMIPPRPDGNGPDYQNANAEVRQRETIICVFGDVSLTEYVTGPIELPDYPPGHPQQVLYNQAIERMIATGKLERRQVRPGELVKMGFGSFHRDARAHAEGWRLMLRAVRRKEVREQTDGDLWMQMNNYFRPETVQEVLAYQPYAPTQAY